ncbi:hypothetical protein Ga0609869_001771 [Rhodovulum iodosum]|uniref:SRPBCC family protein n=1 Tax=Rhodovulum iodosum TaxID=68291 RepID=A0ABV3XSX1_9RHOB|nr:SRPBCC family protein [Rhodovulum robiginosum]RSK39631.1 SRPBCC family protein [Rhodovulum robiginosum]
MAPAALWEEIGGFCAIADRYLRLASCEEEEIEGARHRRLMADDGAEILELYADKGGATGYRYEIVESPLPVADYEATFAVAESGAGSTVTWSSRFTADGVTEAEAAGILGGICGNRAHGDPGALRAATGTGAARSRLAKRCGMHYLRSVACLG